MKLLLDQGLPRSAAQMLRDNGINALHVSEIGMAASDDADILESAHDDGRIVITLDADFHSILVQSGKAGPSIVRIRIEGLKGKEAAVLIEQLLSQCQADLMHGALITVQVGRLRVRRLPLRLDL